MRAMSLATVHAMKGLQASAVQVLDDGVGLCCPWAGCTGEQGDGYAAWYVALTRAQHTLAVPRKVVALLRMLHNGRGELQERWAAEMRGKQGVVVGGETFKCRAHMR